VRGGIETIAQIPMSSGRALSFTGIHRPSRDDAVVTVKRAIQRVLNARLLASLAAARSTTVHAVLKETRVLPPCKNDWPVDGVGLEEFLHNSDRGTLSADVLKIATDLQSEEPSDVVRSVAVELVRAMGQIKARIEEGS